MRLSYPPCFSKFGKRTSGLPKAELDQRWYAVVVRGFHEFKLAESLRAQCVSYFLPMQRDSERMELVFPGFLFLLGTVEDLYRAYSVRPKRVITVWRTLDQKELRQDLREVARVVQHGYFLERLMKQFSIGRAVRVIDSHPKLAGLEGKVDSVNGRRVYLRTAFMTGAASFEIEDAKYLEVI